VERKDISVTTASNHATLVAAEEVEDVVDEELLS
jgi:hypothetical protein